MRFLARHLLVLILAVQIQAAVPARGTTILWDAFGVPHIFAKDNESLFYAFGWAQMQSHANLLLHLYGESRARAAEYWGESYLTQDEYYVRMGLPARSQEWYRRQTPEFRRYLDAFAAGITAYASAHSDQIAPDNRVVLPVTGLDVIQHAQRIFYFQYIAPPRIYASDNLRAAIDRRSKEDTTAGSNAWAIGPSRSATGHALLLANPHQTWTGDVTFYEAQLNAPGVNLYGAVQVGFPVMRYAFNDSLGFSQTVNTIDVADLYRLTLRGNGYLFDGAVKAFEQEEATLKVKQADGSLLPKRVVIRRSIQGPVVAQNESTAYALRIAGLDRPGLLSQYWEMGLAQNLEQFQAALDQHQAPMFTVMYADRAGHIMHLFNGIVPQRPTGNWQFWSGTVPGDTSATLWTKILPLSSLPRVIDPPSGWLQNTNDPPWSTTYPPQLDPNRYPAYLAPRTLTLRTERSIHLLSEPGKLTLDDFIHRKCSTRSELADRILNDLLAAVNRSGTARAKRAVAVLQAWDRQFEADSRGAALFERFARLFLASPDYAVPLDTASPLTTPRGLHDPAEAARMLDRAAAEMESIGMPLDVSWGAGHRFERGTMDLAANGGPGTLGIFRVFHYTPMPDGRSAVSFGDTYIAAVEFSTPVRARVLLNYGNSSQPGSKHLSDQLPFAARKELRTAWRTREEIEAHLEGRKVF